MLEEIKQNVQPGFSQPFSLPIKLFNDDQIGFVELLEVFGSDLTVVNAARVSFHKESFMEPVKGENGEVTGYKVSERDEKLIEYLAQHKHIAPFFHPQLRFRIRMPLIMTKEWFRHTVGFARNEVSRRYVTEAPNFFIPKKLRKRDVNVKQGSSQEIIETNDFEVEKMREYCAKALEYYNYLLEIGVCPEQARLILPQSMYSEFIETASLSGYARLVSLRIAPDAQKEIQGYAQLISNLIEPVFPASWKALRKAAGV